MVSDRSNGINWSFIAAIAGLACLITAFGLGLYVGTLNYPYEERYQPYHDASNEPTKAEAFTVIPKPESLKYKEPCKNPEGRDESQLCAEWKAARAAERGALWAERGVWITLIGAIGLFVTILQGRNALGKARDANLIAKETADKQLRAYVYTDIGEFGLDDDDRLLINLQIKNFGQTPAKKTNAWIQSYIGKYPLEGDLPSLLKGVEMSSVTIAQGSFVEFLHTHNEPLSDEHMTDIIAEGTAIYIYGEISYFDVFEREQTTKYRMFCTGQEALTLGRFIAHNTGNEST